MKTHIDILYDYFNEKIGALKILSNKGSSKDELKELLVISGPKLELFLKSVAFPKKSKKNNFEDFIDELKKVGLQENFAISLQDFRNEYNNAKHIPSFNPKITSTLNVFIRVLVLCHN